MNRAMFKVAVLAFFAAVLVAWNTDHEITNLRLQRMIGGEGDCWQDGNFSCNGFSTTSCSGGCSRTVNGVQIIGCEPLDSPIDLPPPMTNSGANTQFAIEVQGIPAVLSSSVGYGEKLSLGNWTCFVVYNCGCENEFADCEKGSENDNGRSTANAEASYVDGEWGECNSSGS